MDEEEETELRNPFPSPPSHYTKYTTHNLHLLDLLRERAGDADLFTVNQYELLKDQTDVPDWPLVQLEKPRVDWILEEGRYTVFGDTWFVRTSPSEFRCMSESMSCAIRSKRQSPRSQNTVATNCTLRTPASVRLSLCSHLCG